MIVVECAKLDGNINNWLFQLPWTLNEINEFCSQRVDFETEADFLHGADGADLKTFSSIHNLYESLKSIPDTIKTPETKKYSNLSPKLARHCDFNKQVLTVTLS